MENTGKMVKTGCLITGTILAILASLVCLFLGGISALVGATTGAAVLITGGVLTFIAAFFALLMMGGN